MLEAKTGVMQPQARDTWSHRVTAGDVEGQNRLLEPSEGAWSCLQRD